MAFMVSILRIGTVLGTSSELCPSGATAENGKQVTSYKKP